MGALLFFIIRKGAGAVLTVPNIVNRVGKPFYLIFFLFIVEFQIKFIAKSNNSNLGKFTIEAACESGIVFRCFEDRR